MDPTNKRGFEEGTSIKVKQPFYAWEAFR